MLASRFFAFLAVFVVVGGAADAAAQNRGSKFPRLPPGERGGMAQAPIAGADGRWQVVLLELPEVRQELKITGDELANLALLYKEFEEPDLKYYETMNAKIKEGTKPDVLAGLLKQRGLEIESQLKEVLGDRLVRFKEVRRQLVGINAALQGDWEVRDAISLNAQQRDALNGWKRHLKDVLKGRAEPHARLKGFKEDVKSLLDARAKKKEKKSAPAADTKAEEVETVADKEVGLLDELDLIRKHETAIHKFTLYPAQWQRWLDYTGKPIEYRLPKRFPVYDVLSKKDRAILEPPADPASGQPK